MTLLAQSTEMLPIQKISIVGAIITLLEAPISLVILQMNRMIFFVNGTNLNTILELDFTSSELTVAPHDVEEITMGHQFTCARSYEGMVKCWGYNYQGQLGIGNTVHVGDQLHEMGEYQAFTDLGSNLSAVDIDAGANHACAAMASGEVRCWGYGYDYRLGQSSTNNIGDNPNEMGDNMFALVHRLEVRNLLKCQLLMMHLAHAQMQEMSTVGVMVTTTWFTQPPPLTNIIQHLGQYH